MKGDLHVRICGGRRLRCRRLPGPCNGGGAKGAGCPDLVWWSTGVPGRSQVNGSRPQAEVKSFDIHKSMVWEAFQRVKANKGAPGADGVTIEQFEQNLSGNLFSLGDRSSSVS